MASSRGHSEAGIAGLSLQPLDPPGSRRRPRPVLVPGEAGRRQEHAHLRRPAPGVSRGNPRRRPSPWHGDGGRRQRRRDPDLPGRNHLDGPAGDVLLD